MTVFVPGGNANTVASQIPGVVVQNFDAPGFINPIDVGVIAAAGIATYGPVDTVVEFSTPQEGAQIFGPQQNARFDLMTFVTASSQAASAYGGSPLYLGLRVTDGTDTAATKNILDTGSAVGLVASAFYTGSYGDNTSVQIAAGSQASTYKAIVSQANNAQSTEVFDNIAGSGRALWESIVDAINEGQSNIRPASQLIVASLPTAITLATITAAGSYATLPAIGATIGSGASLTLAMKALNTTIATSQSSTGSYAPGDTLTLSSGTFTTAAIFTINTTSVASAAVAAGGSGGTPGTATVTGTTGTGTKFQANVTISGGGAISAINSITVAGNYTVNPTVLTAEPVTGGGLTGATLNIKMGVLSATNSTPGSYTVLPASPVTTTTSGSGTGCTLTVLWGALSAAIVGGGTDYTPDSVLTFAGGGGTGGAAGTVSVGTSVAPNLATYTLANGTDGNTGVTVTDLIGDDTTTPRKGMYAFRNTVARILVLVDNYDTTTFSTQLAFCRAEAKFGFGVIPKGTTTANAVTLMQAAAAFDVDGYFKVMNGDWIYYNDTTNRVERLISPQCHAAGMRAILPPEQSTLNKQIFTVYDTQRSRLRQQYQQDEILLLQANGIDYIGLPPPGQSLPSVFCCRLGINTSQQIENIDDHVMMLNFFIGFSAGDELEGEVGKLQNDAERLRVKNTIQVFLQALVDAGRIGSSNPNVKPYLVVCDSTNNPDPQVRKGILQVDEAYSDFSVIRRIILNQTRNGATLNVLQSTAAP